MKYLVILLVVMAAVVGLVALNTIYPFLPPLANWSNRLTQTLKTNWQTSLAPSSAVSAEGLSGQIMAQIAVAVDQAVTARLAGLADGGGSTGVIVQTATGTTVSADAIKQSFSDQVEIYPAAGGQSGVIIPVFRQTKGQPYLYFMTPLKP